MAKPAILLQLDAPSAPQVEDIVVREFISEENLLKVYPPESSVKLEVYE